MPDSHALPEPLLEAARVSRAWPFEEARAVIRRIETGGVDREVLFETGYGPSGLPHIGTFGEVARTTMVRHAFRVLTGDSVPTRLLCFSDDMDGMRKVPDNVPNRQMLAGYAERRGAGGETVQNPTPLSAVPDPFGGHASFAGHNNARLRAFLDRFGFDYEFASATAYYSSGRFDDTLKAVLARHREVADLVVGILGPERRKTYCPFLPIVEEWNGERRRQVLHHARIEEARADDGVAVFQVLNPMTGEADGPLFEHSVLGGHCKLQWRPDWALRWVALGVDYEMSGKDLIDSVRVSSQICRALGGRPPEGFNYELFLDENGEKISKSRGNGLTIEEWLAYAGPESLSYFMYGKPKSAKRLYFDVIPRAVDDYFRELAGYPGEPPERQVANPVWHIHDGEPPADGVPVSFAMLLNLVSASNAEDRDVLWGYISRYAPGATPTNHPKLDELVGYAIRYFHDFVKPAKAFRLPSETERAALQELDRRLAALPADADGETIQTEVYAVGKAHEFEPLRDWFTALYQVLLGQDQGPRFGSFVALYGIAETRALIASALAGRLAA